MKPTPIAHVVFPRVDPVRPVLGFVWDAVEAVAASAPDLSVEVLIPVPARAFQAPQALYRRLGKRKKAWPEGLEERLLALSPRPTLIPYPPLPLRSIESAAIALGAALLIRPKSRRPRLIQGSFLDEGGYAAAIAGRIIGAASIAVAHGTDVRAARGSLEGSTAGGRRRRALRTLREATRILAVSHHLAGELALLGAKAEVVRFTTRGARFERAPRASAHNPRTVLFAGLISRGKGVDLLLEAFARLRRKDALLVLVGPEAGDIDPRAEAARLHIADRVRILPAVPQQDLAAHYAESACVVLPSRNEGYGIVLVEALLTGRPVVGADVGGIREIIADARVGRLAAPEDPDALARAIDEVLDGFDHELYPPEALRARALPLTWEAVGPRLAEISRGLIHA